MNNATLISRREFVVASLALGAAGMSSGGLGQDFYGGPYLIRIHAGGGWDLSLFCDPKVNQSGEVPITDWSREADIAWAGHLLVAPIANNVATFDRLGPKTLVINGVDTQTNAHETGERHTWTGAPDEGRPSITALFAAARAPEQPLALTSFGGFSATAGLIRPTLTNSRNLKQLTKLRDQSNGVDAQAESQLLERFRVRGLDLVTESELKSPWLRHRAQEYLRSHVSKQKLGEVHEILPDELEASEPVFDGYSDLKQQLQVSLLAFKSGLAASSECSAGGGWDSHFTGEYSQISFLQALNNGLTYVWDLAESLEIADQLIVIVSSDFGRTPYYNSFGGKDHWPINSYLIMANDPIWGGRVVGHTDEAQNASKISPSTLKVSSTGSIIYPKHVHHALHHYLGIDDYARSVGYDFKNTELYDFFNPALTTAGPMPNPLGSNVY
jgi:hypothetical protein